MKASLKKYNSSIIDKEKIEDHKIVRVYASTILFQKSCVIDK